MQKTYLIPEQGVNALYAGGEKHLLIAKGKYATIDPEQQAFLDSYPGLAIESVTPEAPAPIYETQRDPTPQPPAVLSGGPSGGGAAAITSRRR